MIERSLQSTWWQFKPTNRLVFRYLVGPVRILRQQLQERYPSSSAHILSFRRVKV